MQCPTCGTNNATHALHCEKCGALLADAEPGFRDDGPTAAAVSGVGGAIGAIGVMDPLGAPDAGAPAQKKQRRERGEESGWLTSALVLGTALFAAIALLGIWWNLRSPFVDPVPKLPGGLAVAPFNAGNNAPLAPASGSPAATTSEASTALARAQALAAVDAAASRAAAEVATTNVAGPTPLTASAATAALTAAATTSAPPPASPSASASGNAPDDMMQLLSRREGSTASAPRPAANADLPAHYDGNDIGPIAAAEAQQPGSAQVASAPSAATTVAAALAQCERYRWYEVIPKQQCIWAVCKGRWGRDGCPAGTNPGESR